MLLDGSIVFNRWPCYHLQKDADFIAVVRMEIRQMAAKSANSTERAAIRRYAAEPAAVRITRTAEYDLLGRGMTKDDICAEIVSWIDSGERIKKVVLRGLHEGVPAFEMKPHIDNALFYLKVALCDTDGPGAYMLLISAHPDH
jgi:hypothetical protein